MRPLRIALIPALGIAVVVAAALFVYLDGRPEIYEARASLIVSNDAPYWDEFPEAFAGPPALDVSTYVVALRDRPIAREALIRSGTAEPLGTAIDALRRETTIRADDAGSSALIHVLVRTTDRGEAARSADAIADAAVAWDADRARARLGQATRSLEGQVAYFDGLAAEGEPIPASVVDARQTASERVEILRALAQGGTVGALSVFTYAGEPGRVGPRSLLQSATAGVAAFLLAFAFFAGRALRDPRLASATAVADAAVSVPLFGAVPVDRRYGPRALRAAATRIRNVARAQAMSSDRVPIVVVSGTSARDGSADLAAEIATAFAHDGTRTLAIEIDHHEASLTRALGVAEESTQTTLAYLRNESRGPIGHVIPAPGVSVDVLPMFVTGTGLPPIRDVAGDVIARTLPDELERLQAVYEAIVVHAAPVLEAAEVLAIAPSATFIAVTVGVGRASAADVVNARDAFGEVASNVDAVVATSVGRRDSSLGRGARFAARSRR